MKISKCLKHGIIFKYFFTLVFQYITIIYKLLLSLRWIRDKKMTVSVFSHLIGSEQDSEASLVPFFSTKQSL